ncbi:MAG: DUF2953 domain-containing protein [Desulfotomaculaceae bacterium]|nr:DUF2953 domain-containing protein [Desulfotomaculaceae bacterium]
MNGTQLVIILVGMILLILFLTSLKMRLQYRRQGSDDRFSLELSLWRGLISYKLEVPVVKADLKHGFRPWRWLFWPRTLSPAFKIEAKVTGKNDPKPVEKIKEEEILGLARILLMIKKSKCFFANYMPAIRFFLGRVYLRRFQWRTEFGMEEPHLTGFLVGLAGGVKGLLLAQLYRVIHSGAARPTVVITPKFEKPGFDTRIDCEFDVKIGYIILTGVKFVFVRFKS